MNKQLLLLRRSRAVARKPRSCRSSQWV